jgi:hypothetical protein
MATPSKINKTQKAKTRSPANARKGDVEVPDGFDDVSASMEKLPKWDFTKDEQLDATVKKIQEVTVTKGKVTRETHVAHVITEDGEELALWESAGLKELFEVMDRGSVIRVVYQGTIALDDNRDMHQFKCFHRAA